MGRGMQSRQQSIEQISNDPAGSANVTSLMNEIQILVENIKERPVVSLTMTFPPIGIATHG